MEQILVLSIVLSGLVDPRQHLVDLALVVVLHELATIARKVVSVDRRGIEDGDVTLGSLDVVPVDLAHKVVEVQAAHCFS